MSRRHDEPRWLRWATPAVLFAFALAVRAAPWRDVYVSGQVIPMDNDAFYHLRRIVYSVFRGGSLEFDRYLNHPTGAQPIWPPLFDRVCALLVAPFVGEPGDASQARLEALAVWLPPLLGASAVVVCYALARRHWGRAAGTLAALVLSLLSAHFWYSRLGLVDHHVAVGLAALLLLAAGLALLERHQAGARTWLTAGWLGVARALCLLIWPGSLLHVSLVELPLLGYLLTRRDPASARSFAAALAASHAVSLLLLLPSGAAADWAQWGAFSPVVLSRFQPLLEALACVVLAASAWLWRQPSLGADRRRRLAVFAALSAGVAALAFASLPGLREGAGDAWRWLAKRESFQSQVSESQPLLVEGGRFTLGIASMRLSLLVFALPVAAPWLVWRQRRLPQLPRSVAIAVFALGLLAVTLLQKRFFDSASIGLALVSGVVGVELWRAAGGRRHARLLRTALAAGLLLALLPTLASYRRYVGNELRALRGEPASQSRVLEQRAIGLQTALWLRDHTPPTRGWLDPRLVPEYAILSPWPLGHLIEYVARRPTLVDNFGDDLGGDAFAFVDGYYRAPETPEAVAAARARGVRYVIAQAGASYLTRPAARGSLAHALFWLDGSRSREVAALEHHRLVFESTGARGEQGARARLKVYELVAGAELFGQAAPGAALELRLDVTSNQGRRFVYHASQWAAPDGRYSFRVPYASGGGKVGELRTAARYRLRCGSELAELSVSEQAVQDGARQVAPALCRDDRTPGAPRYR